jgi:hypothetical protein
VPLGILLPLVIGIGPKLVGGDAELEHRLAAVQCLLFWRPANEARDNHLIEIHFEILLSALHLGAK